MKKHLTVKRLTAFGLASVIAISSTVFAAGSYAKYQDQLHAAEENGTIYTALSTGRWDNQKVDGYEGNYSVYVPSNFEYCSPGVVLLTPDGMTAKDWLDSELGQQWISVADDNAIALTVVEPKNGKWNLNDKASMRDDEAYLHGIYSKLTDKSDNNESVFDLNERALYLVGYDEGATAANEMAMLWPALFAGLTAVGGEAVPSSVAQELGDSISYPFAEATTAGREENNLPNREIPVRVWQIETDDSHKNDVNYWIAANGLSESNKKNNSMATVISNTDTDGDAEPEQVWYSSADSSDAVAPSVIYTQFLADVQRFVGDPGGYLEWTIKHENDGEHGYFLNEEKVDGYTRRWFTYVPQSYDGTQEYPLVVATHGYSSAITAFTGDSRWQNVADQYGIIITFAQAYVNGAAYADGRIPVPIWNNYSVSESLTPSYSDPDDVAFIKYLVDKTKTDYEIDASRVYATGHSNGSAMAWMLAQDAGDYFTAVAPIGFNCGYPGYANGTVDYSGCEENQYLLPVWCMTGEFDILGADNYSTDTNNGKTVSYWKAQNGVYNVSTKTSEVRSTRTEHIYSTTTYAGEYNAPLVRVTQVSNSCHAYMEDQAYMIWEEFFSKYTRSEDGTLYYNGQKIEKQDGILSDSFTDISGHWGESFIKEAVDDHGLFAGTSNTTFSPDIEMSRAMLVTVLYRMDVNAQASTVTSLFDDVADDSYYVHAVTWAKENGIVAGVSDTQFAPDSNISREQVAVMLYQYASSHKLDVSASASLDGFKDGAQTSDYAKTAMKWAVGSKLIVGKDGAALDPQGSATRTEVATILTKFCETVAE